MAYRLALLVGLTTMLGCFSGKPDLDFADVHGTVTLQGEPLRDATVRFQPANGRPSYGKTNEAGEFKLNFMGREWGALVGNHTVAITTEDRIENPETGETRWQPEILPPKYNKQSELTANVEPGDNEFNFSLDEMKKGAKRP
ncbi:transthyretin-like family protein [Bremerella sp. T1]|uniref:carboxypeptidase regulatory-like domain-containing protein n=1 Tax=Bremerella sp. TYQ1 TaxID=3119568 RepID=UPI001CCE1FE0|nr:carboxypeptidase regulatory-like domain-containing protein [Bremerella volcania]UBM36118.1 carboxypeptidase regulatory-like domain-containing protein [Bremerella volcania]